jgi:hypothetical protein
MFRLLIMKGTWRCLESSKLNCCPISSQMFLRSFRLALSLSLAALESLQVKGTCPSLVRLRVSHATSVLTSNELALHQRRIIVVAEPVTWRLGHQ